MVKTFQLIALLIGFGASAQDSLDTVLSKFNDESIPYISAEELKMQQNNSDFLLMDTRERKEFEVSKIEGAVYIGYNQFSINQFVNFATDKTRPIVVYCSLGIRSEDIGEKLKKAGYTNVKNLYGGIFEWKNKGFPVVDSDGNKTEKVHAYSKQWGKWLLKGEKVF
ncbi:MAG: rhodanese-like domain-containing protein [Flavobacteriaceae bacterium]|nr:rhodanese-like domain-containing protein [Flavobacteriaceae bacterium]